MSKTEKHSEITECVRKNLDKYFRDLDGAKPNPVYDMVLHAVEKPMIEIVLREAQLAIQSTRIKVRCHSVAGLHSNVNSTDVIEFARSTMRARANWLDLRKVHKCVRHWNARESARGRRRQAPLRGFHVHNFNVLASTAREGARGRLGHRLRGAQPPEAITWRRTGATPSSLQRSVSIQ